MSRGPYHLATEGMTSRERADWFHSHYITAETHDPTVPNRFICQGAPKPNRQERMREQADGTLSDTHFGEYYRQGGTHA